MYANGYNIYKSNSVNYASKEQLLLMLVEGAVKFAKMGRQAIIDKDIKKAHDSLTRTQDIFTELMVSLDRTNGDWTNDLYDVYGFIKGKLVQANMTKKLEVIDEVIPLIEDINTLWQDVYKEAKKHA
ncbi:MAG: flagellar export chaperone FliS [Clostridium beijerinckii]|jgi:flagellar protein FliS|uniref:flagellar export chaperone FliS n=1 Tax=Clostridium beijerinckii TaxID=1520 RepID=UPI001494B0C9|nr:flagellar export chaperone FliS [Clostridium beijerinckii]MCI1477735.1 flagellar export chaperone FliS [Clostridium beijerinckii]MCI1577949.1 flagellar export chaperone FliS [Clostridium beijerinckii]MCI1583130.1 flagellar export chaperone FliS [Clostridium beijerinckii]MCI1620640.1 flagellar export chaperone FliS [Clostridium beijerinckii]NOW87877.1 flagellar protein FliS [Clostridium beijerinckii]